RDQRADGEEGDGGEGDEDGAHRRRGRLGGGQLVLAAELEEALDRELLMLEADGQEARVVGGALEEVLEAALRVVGQRIDVRDVLLRARDAERRAALGERARAAD